MDGTFTMNRKRDIKEFLNRPKGEITFCTYEGKILDEKEVQAMEHGKILAIYKMSSEIEAGYFWSSYIPRANGPQNV
jgi:hypothetical protein